MTVSERMITQIIDDKYVVCQQNICSIYNFMKEKQFSWLGLKQCILAL